MKNLVLILAIASLWGCGPQQSSTERDQQQTQAEYDRLKAYYKPFAGTYVGTAAGVEVSLYLQEADDVTTSSGVLQNIRTPSLKGQLLECLSDSPCFTVNTSNPYNTRPTIITRASANLNDSTNMKIFSSGAASASGGPACTVGDCTAFIYDVHMSGKTLTGQVLDGTTPFGTINLTRVQ